MTSPNAAPSSLVAALLAARKSISPTVRKAGHNKHQDYKYVGHEHVLVRGGARKTLLEHGLVLLLESTEFAGADGGGKMLRWRGQFALLHVPSGEQRTLVYEATTGANDKAGFVASTALDRTAHMRVLELAGSDQENPEHDSHEPKPRERPLAEGTRSSSTTAARAEQAPASTSPTSSASPSSTTATGRERELPTTADGWRASHNTLCDKVFEETGRAPASGADEYGLHVPTLPHPSFSANAKQHAGARYDAVPGGYLRQVLWVKPAFWKNASHAQALWVSYLVARHELAKLEQARAEQALGAGGAA